MVELLETVLSHGRDEVIGIGMDYQRRFGPPERFAEAYTLAERAGLKRTVHSETGPLRHITVAIDLSGAGESITATT